MPCCYQLRLCATCYFMTFHTGYSALSKNQQAHQGPLRSAGQPCGAPVALTGFGISGRGGAQGSPGRSISSARCARTREATVWLGVADLGRGSCFLQRGGLGQHLSPGWRCAHAGRSHKLSNNISARESAVQIAPITFLPNATYSARLGIHLLFCNRARFLSTLHCQKPVPRPWLRAYPRYFGLFRCSSTRNCLNLFPFTQ
jgi:hypothetical protein